MRSSSFDYFNMQPQIIPLPEPDVSETALQEVEREGARQVVRGLLSNEHEQRLFYLLFYCGLTPQSIVQRFPLIAS